MRGRSFAEVVYVSRARLWEGVLVHVGVWASHGSSKPRKEVMFGIGFA